MGTDTTGETMADGATRGAVWAPSAQRRDAARITAFRRRAEALAGRPLAGYGELHAWSIEEPALFWRLVWDVCGVVGTPGQRVIEVGSAEEPWATRFFPDARLNVVDTLLDGRGATGDAVAVVAVDERGRRRELTWDALRSGAASVAAALRAEGVGPGDRVAAWLPNTVETLLVMLGAASVGAVFSSTSPDFGPDGVLDRFGQIRPAVLVAADGYTYGGKGFDRRPQLEVIAAGLPGTRVVVVPFLEDAPALRDGWTSWSDWLAPHEGARLAPEPLPFDHPWYVLYSSGTTGVPKCIVHRAGGVLVQHLKEQRLHCDIGPGDRVLYFTTCGWMMWNWLVSVLGSGATAVLYDGSPAYPGVERLWALAESERLTFLGASAKYFDTVRSSGLRPGSRFDLSHLRTLASTGSPLAPETFTWLYGALGPEGAVADLHLASISGGTDLCGCFVGGVPTEAVHPGELQGPMLGMATDVCGEDGGPVPVGERGELVCRAPFPSMPLGFWADGADGPPVAGVVGPKYRAAYFERFPGVWAHGDFASWTAHGGMVIHGRSDTTLNPGGVRIGTAEIYRLVEHLPEVAEALVFGQPHGDDVRVVLLVRLADGFELNAQLEAEIRRRIREGCTPRHVPALILAVEDLPRTRSGKLAELAVTDAVAGREVRNTTALANPEAIDAIARRPELRG